MSRSVTFPISLHAGDGMAVGVRGSIMITGITTTRKRDGSG